MNVEEAVESYRNGNITEVRTWLKRKASKLQVLEFAELLDLADLAGIKDTKRLLR